MGMPSRVRSPSRSRILCRTHSSGNRSVWSPASLPSSKTSAFSRLPAQGQAHLLQTVHVAHEGEGARRGDLAPEEAGTDLEARLLDADGGVVVVDVEADAEVVVGLGRQSPPRRRASATGRLIL